MTITSSIGVGSYALYNGLDSISYNCIKYLMDHDEMIWRLLYYKTPDAWDVTISKPNLTQEQKGALIYDGSDDASLFNVFMDSGDPDVETSQKTILRIHPYSLIAPNRTVGSLQIMMECYTYYKLNHLTNYKVRTDMILTRLLNVFNGATIDGTIGNLHLDDMGTFGTKMILAGQLPYKGKWLLLGNRIG